MRTCELPRSEWGRLARTPIAEVLYALPAETRLVVVEDDAGAIVGTWAVMRYVHVEGIWIAESCRGQGTVARRLLSGMRHAAREFGAAVVLTASLTDEVRDYIVRLGGRALPGEHYVLPVVGR